jgi:hypothetical protein
MMKVRLGHADFSSTQYQPGRRAGIVTSGAGTRVVLGAEHGPRTQAADFDLPTPSLDGHSARGRRAPGVEMPALRDKSGTRSTTQVSCQRERLAWAETGCPGQAEAYGETVTIVPMVW